MIRWVTSKALKPLKRAFSPKRILDVAKENNEQGVGPPEGGTMEISEQGSSLRVQDQSLIKECSQPKGKEPS